MTLGKRMQRLARDEFLSDLALERRAVGPVLGHGFHLPETNKRGQFKSPNLSTARGALQSRG